MTGFSERYDRSMRLFGVDGQAKLSATSVAILGVGGLGSAAAQHVALLGVQKAVLVDYDDLDNTSRNRFIGCRYDDPVPGSAKVALAGRLIREINPDVGVSEIYDGFVSELGFAAVKSVDVILGCFDEDGPRAILNELCAAYGKPYIDLASDVPEPGAYGGRVCTAWQGNGCLLCLGELDDRAVQAFLRSDVDRELVDKIYGVKTEALAEKGPSVSPVNGVIAALAAVEFMVAVTGLREPVQLLNYRGHVGTVSARRERKAGCYVCEGIRNQAEKADVERYLKLPHLRRRRFK